MARLQVGEQIAGYRLIELAGAGGMGRVYRAAQPQLGRTVALKLIRPELASDEAFRERFQREAILAASVDHPGVIPIFEADETDGVLFVAMRWVDGPDLRQLLAEKGALDPRKALEILAQLAAALDAAHQGGLVHRDVKPANVLVEGERVFLSDFGLARSSAGGDSMTQPGGFMGTPDYVAPELIEGASADVRSDVYALGCVFYEMITGCVPHPVDGLLAKLHAHSTKVAAAPSQLRPGLPRGFDEVAKRALAKDPRDRFATAGELAAAARAALRPPRLARRPAWPMPLPLPLRPGLRTRSLAAGAGVLAVAAVVAVLLLVSGRGVPTTSASRAAGAFACGAPQHVHWSAQPVQGCPLTAPLPPRGWVPVYARPLRNPAGRTPGRPSAGWLHGTTGQLFECQAAFSSATYHHPREPWFNDWWAHTVSDDDHRGWVPEVYFAGRGNDQPAAGLRRCPAPGVRSGSPR